MIIINDNNMKFIDCTDGKLNEIKKFAEKIGLSNQFNSTLKQLEKHATDKNKVTLYPDYAPYSLYFMVRVKNEFIDDTVMSKSRGPVILDGGVIYHGKHDHFGSGSSPTFSVTVDKAEGWRIHT